eukprot:CAMPEP_0173071562 /NCGR_PEP_ID=MMETSP1102-20130122/9302_1 /TAXON_ID=49646 /ORGANISM="Geminigera sp., Strain Caron Lab Isolate" /LENGTH=52 /DNA_ID=CAMNT_0013940077 /DNA_START=285 /DNA_END=443 /DNA_ORIENTATION=-
MRSLLVVYRAVAKTLTRLIDLDEGEEQILRVEEFPDISVEQFDARYRIRLQL